MNHLVFKGVIEHIYKVYLVSMLDISRTVNNRQYRYKASQTDTILLEQWYVLRCFDK